MTTGAKWCILLTWVAVLVVAQPARCGEPTVARMGNGDTVPTVGVRIGAKVHRFAVSLVDPFHLVDSSLIGDLGRRLANVDGDDTRGNKQEIIQYAMPQMWIGKTALSQDAMLGATDLSWLQDMLGRDIDGILGAPLVVGYRVELDFDKGELRLWNKNDDTPLRQHPSAARHRIAWNPSGVVELQDVACSDTTLTNCQISTAETMCDLGLRRDVFHALLRNRSINAATVVKTVATFGTADIQCGRARFVTLGNTRVTGPTVVQSSENRICLPLMRRFWWLIDFSGGVVYTEKSKQFDSLPRPLINGLRLAKRDNQWSIATVRKTGWSNATQLRVDDVIVEVNGHPTTGLSRDAIWAKIVDVARTSGSIVVDRNGKRLTLSVPKYDYSKEK